MLYNIAAVLFISIGTKKITQIFYKKRKNLHATNIALLSLFIIKYYSVGRVAWHAITDIINSYSYKNYI